MMTDLFCMDMRATLVGGKEQKTLPKPYLVNVQTIGVSSDWLAPEGLSSLFRLAPEFTRKITYISMGRVS